MSRMRCWQAVFVASMFCVLSCSANAAEKKLNPRQVYALQMMTSIWLCMEQANDIDKMVDDRKFKYNDFIKQVSTLRKMLARQRNYSPIPRSVKNLDKMQIDWTRLMDSYLDSIKSAVSDGSYKMDYVVVIRTKAAVLRNRLFDGYDRLFEPSSPKKTYTKN